MEDTTVFSIGEYDREGRLVRVVVSQPSDEHLPVTVYQYDSHDRVIEISRADGSCVAPPPSSSG
jgi:hypothetical protein